MGSLTIFTSLIESSAKHSITPSRDYATCSLDQDYWRNTECFTFHCCNSFRSSSCKRFSTTDTAQHSFKRKFFVVFFFWFIYFLWVTVNELIMRVWQPKPPLAYFPSPLIDICLNHTHKHIHACVHTSTQACTLIEEMISLHYRIVFLKGQSWALWIGLLMTKTTPMQWKRKKMKHPNCYFSLQELWSAVFIPFWPK